MREFTQNETECLERLYEKCGTYEFEGHAERILDWFYDEVSVILAPFTSLTPKQHMDAIIAGKVGDVS